ncbi:MAG: proliferating cell nuclear antigen (pcna) [Candidatus Heimdallarchaeaceae archaeon]
MSFDLQLDNENSKILASNISIISSIVSECFLSINKDSIQIKTFDPTRISMFDFVLKKEAFQEFKVDNSFSLGLNLETFNNMLKTAKKDEVLNLNFDEREQRLRILFKAKNRERSFTLKMIDIKDDNPPPDKVKILRTAQFNIDASFFQQVLKDSMMISDHFKIHAFPDKVIFSCSSFSNEMETVVGPESEEIETESFEIIEESESSYSLEFLNNFMKGIRSSETLTIGFATNKPIILEYNLENKGYLHYMLAPRIESVADEEDYEYDDEDY